VGQPRPRTEGSASVRSPCLCLPYFPFTCHQIYFPLFPSRPYYLYFLCCRCGPVVNMKCSPAHAFLAKSMSPIPIPNPIPVRVQVSKSDWPDWRRWLLILWQHSLMADLNCFCSLTFASLASQPVSQPASFGLYESFLVLFPSLRWPLKGCALLSFGRQIGSCVKPRRKC